MRILFPMYWLTVALLSVAMTACAVADTRSGVVSADVSSDKVSVRLVNPDQFTEVRQNRNYGDVRDGSWLVDLQKYVVKQAGPRLAPGQHLDVSITDIKRAGDFEPWRGPSFADIRVVKEIYPPRIELNYVLKDGNGKTIHEGSSELSDLAFMRRIVRDGSDPLRFEKRLIDDWLSNILPSKK